jgi:hypothetical protein
VHSCDCPAAFGLAAGWPPRAGQQPQGDLRTEAANQRPISAVHPADEQRTPSFGAVDCSGTSARSSTDRASDYGSEGWGFESLRARQVRHYGGQDDLLSGRVSQQKSTAVAPPGSGIVTAVVGGAELIAQPPQRGPGRHHRLRI